MSRRSEAQRRYRKRMIVVTIVYLVAIFSASALVDRDSPVTALTMVLALLPGVAILGFFWAIGRLIVEEQDEFQRLLIVRQSLIATAFAIGIASVWGFLEMYGVVDHVDTYWVAILWFLGFGIGALVNRLRYGTFGQCA